MKLYFYLFNILLATTLVFSAVRGAAQPAGTYGAAASDMAPSTPPKDQSPATMISTLFDGPPKLASGPLDPQAYVSSPVQKLKNPKIAYVNWRALAKILKRLGFENPPTHLTPELEKYILNAAGFAMRMNGEDPSAYLNEFRTLYSIRYGGKFLNFNFGDGRGGSSGYVQRKGIGRTLLVRPWSNGDHGNGVMGLPEAIHEALWAAIFEEELPLGANPVLFIIATGTKVDPAHPETSDDRAITVREDMNRPGYYERNTGVFSELMTPEQRDENMSADQKRMEALIPKIAQALPFPRNLPGASAQEYLRGALNQFIDNVSLQYAAAYARQVYHGATSTSNILIDGRFLDFGTSNAVRGYQKLRIIDSDGANGETTNIKSDLIFEMFEDLRRELPDRFKDAVPTEDEAGALVDQKFSRHVLEQFLILAGTPKELAPEAAATAEGRQFARAIVVVAQAGNDKIVEHAGDPYTGSYHLGAVLKDLLKNKGPRGSTHVATPAPAPMNANDWAILNFKWVNYHATLKTLGIRHGINPVTLERAIEISVDARNRGLEEVTEKPSLSVTFRRQSKIFSSGQDPFAIQRYIDGTIERSIHEYKAENYKIEIPNVEGTHNGRFSHRILDLKTGHEEVVHYETPSEASVKEFSKAAPTACDEFMLLVSTR